MRRLCLLLVLLFARLAAGQTPDTSRRAPGAVVSGGVHDSVRRAPLAGALVQIVGADSLTRFSATATSDSLGRFTLADVPDGRYTLGFLHPMLDSLGVEPPTRELSVAGHRPARADLAIPSPGRLRTAICGPTTAPDSGAVAVGVVRGARDGAPVAGATVTGEWLEFTLGPQGVVRRVPRLTATTGENGWFAVCNVPRAGAMTLVASRGPDSTDRIEVQVPADGFFRRELYLGAARTAADTTRRADSLTPRRVRVGDGRLGGTVVAAAGGRPLAGAQVGIVDGPRTRANERGEWTLADAPLGTRVLEVRAVGYYPERRGVDVVADARPVRVALSTFKAVLDTVRVAAHAYNRADRTRAEFQERRRSGAGRFFAPEDIARRAPINTSDVFRTMSGVHLDRNADGLDELRMRGPFGVCSPAIFLDGHYFEGITVLDLDAMVRPNEITGMEVYTDASTPAQFRRPAGDPRRDLGPCGAVVIWTR